MQSPFGSDPTAEANPDVIPRREIAVPGKELSLEEQITLKELFAYVDFSKEILDEIRRNLSLYDANPEDHEVLRRATARLEKFCLEADSWGFSALYQIGMGLQVLLLDSAGRLQEKAFLGSVKNTLEMLAALLDQCESEYRWRLAIADTLDSLERLTYD